MLYRVSTWRLMVIYKNADHNDICIVNYGIPMFCVSECIKSPQGGAIMGWYRHASEQPKLKMLHVYCNNT